MFGLVENLHDSGTVEEDDDSLKKEDREEGKLVACCDPVGGGRDDEDGEQECKPANESVSELEGRLRPLNQFVRPDSCLKVVAEDSHVLAEVETAAEVGDGDMTLVDRRQIGGIEQPGSKRVFSHAGTGDREELEETSMSEEVEVGRVEMGGDIETLPALTCARPAVFDPRDALAVEVHSAFGDALLLKDFGVEEGHRYKENSGNRKPSRRKAVSVKVPPDHCNLQEEEKETEVAQAEVDLFKVRDPKLASALPLKILL
jgi:hypothetical protein